MVAIGPNVLFGNIPGSRPSWDVFTVRPLEPGSTGIERRSSAPPDPKWPVTDKQLETQGRNEKS
jgi:hypothetical protein